MLERGMVRPENLKKLDRSSFDYICGLKKGEKAVKKAILEAERLDEEENMVREELSAVDVGRNLRERQNLLKNLTGYIREGAYYRDVIMSVMGTLKLQGKDFFEEGRELLMNQELEKGE